MQPRKRRVIDNARGHLDRDGRIAASLRILGEPPKKSEKGPDAALATWFASAGGQLASLIIELLKTPKLNDSQGERVFRRAIELRSELGFEFFVKTVPSALQNAKNNDTQAAILDSVGEITALAADADERADLARVLIGVLPSVQGNYRSNVARWIRELGGRAALESSSSIIDVLGIPGLEVIAREFPESRALKRRLRDLERDESKG